jgi:diguanylate cyclase (GGDEF)-like protein
MHALVDHLAELTGFRDRDRLDVTLVGALRDVLQPDSVTVWACVGEPGQQRWLRRASLRRSDAAAYSDPAWGELQSLPLLTDHSQRMSCLVTQRVIIDAGPPCVFLLPLSTEHGVIGVLEIETGAPLRAEDRRLVCSILRIYHNFHALLDYSERDTLTGLLNRKTFDESFLKVALAPRSPALPAGDARRADAPAHEVYMGVIDIDHFKLVNDRYGHLIGDEVLLLLSRLMRSTFRYGDHLYRFGGEEFVVLMRCIGADDALKAFERLRLNVQGYVFPQVGSATVSIGFTRVLPTDSPGTAFERADRAVYYAKQHGRNQVRDHAQLLADGAIEGGPRIGAVEIF